MSTPYLGEIRIVSFAFAPRGWAQCNGQLMPISGNQALFSLLGTIYGGDGVHNFALPNYQARMPMHNGNGYSQGANGGESAHTLILNEIPSHSHFAVGSTAPASSASATGNAWAVSPENPYATTPNTNLNPAALANTGGGQPHDNMAPYLTLNFVIALAGIFPSRN